MSVSLAPSGPTLLTLTAQIASSFVSSRKVGTGEVPRLVSDIHRTLSGLDAGVSEPGPAPPARETRPTAPAGKAKAERIQVDPKRSVFASHLVCLDCGEKFKMLRRHLQSSHAMTPEQYRARHSLPHTYPLVAPDYAKARSKLAKASGLGKRRKRAA